MHISATRRIDTSSLLTARIADTFSDQAMSPAPVTSTFTLLSMGARYGPHTSGFQEMRLGLSYDFATFSYEEESIKPEN
jgi:hypothetical protein